MSWGGYIPGDVLRDMDPGDFASALYAGRDAKPETDPTPEEADAQRADDREARLPKWARDKLAHLRRELATAERYTRELRGDIPETDTCAEVGNVRRFPLPKGADVRFTLAKPHPAMWRSEIRVRVESDGRLYLNADQTVYVVPASSNALHIELRP